MNSVELDLLQQHRAAAKRKMIAGIVLVASAFVFSFVGVFLAVMKRVNITMLQVSVVAMIVCYAVGIPLLTSGIIRTIRFGVRISRAKAAAAAEPAALQSNE